MVTRGRGWPLVALAAGGILSLGGMGSPYPRQESPPPTPTAPPAATAAASETPKCADCHEDQVKGFLGSPHARWTAKETKPSPEDFCANCHGDGAKHMESGGEKNLIQGFHTGKDAENCLACHQAAGQHDSFSAGVHSNSEAVNCLSCHSIHKADPKSPDLLAKAPGALCATCHGVVSSSFRAKPYAHRLDRGGMTCLDCHNAHGRRGETLRLTRQGEVPCLTCHNDLRGPFVFDHVTGSAGDCLSCHQPHGSSNPNMLLWARVDQLCLSCHSRTGGANTLGSQPPSFHNLALPRWRNCTTCHVAVHGSNLSPGLLK